MSSASSPASLPARSSGPLRSRFAALGLGVTLLAGTLSGASHAEPAAAANDLVGSWYVLVHFRDDAAQDPQWEDKVWRFERQGSRLLWSEYPVVVFRDESGRFERLGSSRSGRSLRAWEPSEGQRAEIQRGLAVVTSGARSKSLRAVPAGGWESAGDARAHWASVIGYHERWQISGPPQRPVFTRADTLAAGRAQGLQGQTVYASEEVADSGREIRGRYERDGVRSGRFRMWKMQSATQVSEAGGSGAAEPASAAFVDRASEAGLQLEEWIAAGPVDLERRSAIRQAIRELVRAHLQRAPREASEPGELSERVEGLTREIEKLLLDEGRSLDEVNARIADGRLGR